MNLLRGQRALRLGATLMLCAWLFSLGTALANACLAQVVDHPGVVTAMHAPDADEHENAGGKLACQDFCLTELAGAAKNKDLEPPSSPATAGALLSWPHPLIRVVTTLGASELPVLGRQRPPAPLYLRFLHLAL